MLNADCDSCPAKKKKKNDRLVMADVGDAQTADKQTAPRLLQHYSFLVMYIMSLTTPRHIC